MKIEKSTIKLAHVVTRDTSRDAKPLSVNYKMNLSEAVEEFGKVNNANHNIVDIG